MMPGRGTHRFMTILRSDSLARTYVSGGREITVLRDITFELEPGAFLAITGPSGSGKSTLLGLLAGLDRPTRGRVVLDGHDLAALSEDERARVRAEKVGFVFQSFHLIPTLTARENIQVPLELQGRDGRGRADELLARVGLGDRGHHYPAQLSGGEQQRVAVARAFAHRPRILFADEPTGNLDAANGANVVALLAELNRELGTTLVLVTHDPDLAARARRAIRLHDGALVEDSCAELRLRERARCRGAHAAAVRCDARLAREPLLAPARAARRARDRARRRRAGGDQLVHRQPARLGAARGTLAAGRRPAGRLGLALRPAGRGADRRAAQRHEARPPTWRGW